MLLEEKKIPCAPVLEGLCEGGNRVTFCMPKIVVQRIKTDSTRWLYTVFTSCQGHSRA